MAGRFFRFPQSRATLTESSILKMPRVRSNQRIQDPYICGWLSSSFKNCHKWMWDPELRPVPVDPVVDVDGERLLIMLLLLGLEDTSHPSSEISSMIFLKQWTQTRDEKKKGKKKRLLLEKYFLVRFILWINTGLVASQLDTCPFPALSVRRSSALEGICFNSSFFVSFQEAKWMRQQKGQEDQKRKECREREENENWSKDSQTIYGLFFSFKWSWFV